PHPLRFRDDVQGERRLARSFRAVDLGDAPARNPADPERAIQGEGTRGNRFERRELAGLGPEGHDRSFAEPIHDAFDGLGDGLSQAGGLRRLAFLAHGLHEQCGTRSKSRTSTRRWCSRRRTKARPRRWPRWPAWLARWPVAL